MLRTVNLTTPQGGTSHVITPQVMSQQVPRVSVAAGIVDVHPILEAVRTGGAQAVAAASEQFDGVRPAKLRVPEQVLQHALEQLDAEVEQALRIAVQRVRTYHQAQRPPEQRVPIVPGGTVQTRWIPVQRVGLYVPGGLAVYPSSVVMNVVAAQAAEVPSIAVTSPPQKDAPPGLAGYPHVTILAACALLGITEVYSAGGAQAIGMFAYGISGQCPPVDLITGPGNRWVAAAQQAVRDVVGVDAEAGPTEIAILADAQANPAFVAADLISQAEHDTAAASVLITDSPELAAAVNSELDRQVPLTKHTQRVQTALTGPQSAIVLVDSLDAAIDAANAYAAEHLEIHTADAELVAARIVHAGAIFVGPYSPVSLGDYCAGSNHVLPTDATARYQAGLSVFTFLRPVAQITYTAAALAEASSTVQTLAHAEDLPAHGQAAAIRQAYVSADHASQP